MSFGDGNLHDKYADVFKAMGMDVPDGFTRERHDRLIEGITRCRSMNAANVAEINRQERVIEEQRRLIANRDESIRNLTALFDVRQDRIRRLEALVRDIMKGDPKCTARSCADCEHDEDDSCGIYRRMGELGIEVG